LNYKTKISTQLRNTKKYGLKILTVKIKRTLLNGRGPPRTRQ